MMSKVPVSALKTIPSRYIGLVCLLHFLLQQQPHTIIYELDVDAFLAVAVSAILDNPSALGALRVCTPFQNKKKYAILIKDRSCVNFDE